MRVSRGEVEGEGGIEERVGVFLRRAFRGVVSFSFSFSLSLSFLGLFLGPSFSRSFLRTVI